jgi:hypothetical protein
MPRIGFEHTIMASKRAKTVRALDHSATVTRAGHGSQSSFHQILHLIITRGRCHVPSGPSRIPPPPQLFELEKNIFALNLPYSYDFLSIQINKVCDNGHLCLTS